MEVSTKLGHHCICTVIVNISVFMLYGNQWSNNSFINLTINMVLRK